MSWSARGAWSGPAVVVDQAWSAAIVARCARQDADAARSAATAAADLGGLDHANAEQLADAAQLADANAVLLESCAFRAAEARLTAAPGRG
jgi:hypothetical protein